MEERVEGRRTIAPAVLVTTARLSALAVPGVMAMAPIPGGVNRLFRRGVSEGVRIEVDGETVGVDLHLILASGVNVRDVSRKVQADVLRAIEEMIGMDVTRVDVHIEDIALAGEELE
jgi:uncharacterized alkaline shock family protein YloU